MSTEPIWSLVEAAEHTNTSRATLQRLAVAGKITGARKSGRGWKVPMSGLIAAGLTVEATPQASTSEQRRIEQAAELREARAEAERWRTRAEGLERELQRTDEHLTDLRRTLAMIETTRAPDMLTSAQTLTDPPAERRPSGRLKRWRAKV
jgi:hypothetical protein